MIQKHFNLHHMASEVNDYHEQMSIYPTSDTIPMTENAYTIESCNDC